MNGFAVVFRAWHGADVVAACKGSLSHSTAEIQREACRERMP